MELKKVNGATAYTWDYVTGMFDSRVVHESKSNIGWKFSPTDKLGKFFETRGGMVGNFFEIMLEEGVQEVHVLIYTTNMSKLYTTIHTYDGKGNNISKRYAEGRQFASLVQHSYIVELQSLVANLEELVPSEQVDHYHEPTKNNSTGIVYNGDELTFSTENSKTVVELPYTSEMSDLIKQVVGEDYLSMVGTLEIEMDTQENVINEVGTLRLKTTEGDYFTTKITDKYYREVYGMNTPDEEIEQLTIEQNLAQIVTRMNDIYKLLKEQYTPNQDVTFEELLNKRLRGEREKFDSIMQDVKEMVDYGNEVSGTSLTRGAIQWLIDQSK